MQREVHLIGGTRSEAIRLAPVALAMRDAGLLQPIMLAAGQHTTTVTRTLAAFGLVPDITVAAAAERTAGSPDDTLPGLIQELDELWSVRTPAAVIVQGDTTVSLAGALAAFWRRVPVVHLEAGVRSDDLGSSSPQEANRRLLAQMATLHLAPTPLAAMNLLDEQIAHTDVLVTGTTVVDATLAVTSRRMPFQNAAVAAARQDSTNRLVLVTAYGSGSGNDPLGHIPAAVRELVGRHPDVEVVLATRPDQAAQTAAEGTLAGVPRVTVTGPLSYPDLSRLLCEAYLVLTDSDGIAEEATAFGVPTLVPRDGGEPALSLTAERVKTIGSDTEGIVAEASALLDSRFRRDAMAAGNTPYGDGLAARRTAQAAAALLGLAPAPDAMPVSVNVLSSGAHA
ncbi:UDP-N-acetylglucosamine 2-epimerase (non-hydrolyzing) [Actinoplanes sp. NPDC023936]|uniref:non-hydrolyzing UDP-N-acetylglucosamine 2-epimerase n=1 Tax=Actinoplanes sp. NPDC023936 TaxID=3154910 RepID=UPI0033C67888